LRDVFGMPSPYNVPYGFFLTDGAKMSSSKGIGASAREMNAFLSPEMLRYLMLSTPPKRAINFSPSENYIVKLYNDFDGVRNAAFSGLEDKDQQREIYRISELDVSENYSIPGFSLVKNLVQMPHIDIFTAARELKGEGLTEMEASRLGGRIQSARFWLDHYAEEDDKFAIQHELTDEMISKLEPEHFGFIDQFREGLRKIEWKEDLIQQQVFDSSRMVPCNPKSSFKAMYICFLNKDRGPQVGNLLFYLGKDMVMTRLEAVQIDYPVYWASCSVGEDELQAFGKEQSGKVNSSKYNFRAEHQVSCLEFVFNLDNGQQVLRRLFFDYTPEPDTVVSIVDNFTKETGIVVQPD
ncbi:MAG TPA: hypothetical protein PKW10_10320, partial [Saprospiraceae bacterium]|nr:hypothetical protein [Saprospiraceae bacterium]